MLYWWVKPFNANRVRRAALCGINGRTSPVPPQPDQCAHKTHSGANGKVHSPIFDSKKVKDPIDFLILSTVPISRGVICIALLSLKIDPARLSQQNGKPATANSHQDYDEQ